MRAFGASRVLLVAEGAQHPHDALPVARIDSSDVGELCRECRECLGCRDAESRLLDFQQHYEQIATPFEWKFTKNDLNALLERIAAHDNADPALAA